MRSLLVAGLLSIFACAAHAADKALILNDQEQAAYREVMEQTIRAYGLLSQVGRNASFFAGLIDQAGTITERKASAPEPSAAPPAPPQAVPQSTEHDDDD